MSKFVLRPLASGQHEVAMAGCIFIDGTLYATPDRLTLGFDIRGMSHQNHIRPGASVLYLMALDSWGLFTDTRLSVEPLDLGAPTSVDDLRALNPVQRTQLRRLIVLLSMSLRAALQERTSRGKFSVVLHCLQPKPCDPLDGIRNLYGQTGRAARDIELARRHAAKIA